MQCQMWTQSPEHMTHDEWNQWNQMEDLSLCVRLTVNVATVLMAQRLTTNTTLRTLFMLWFMS